MEPCRAIRNVREGIACCMEPSPAWGSILHPWFRALESPGLAVTQSCLTLCDPMDCSPPRSPVHGILQQDYWSGLPFPSPGNLPDPGIEPRSPTLQAGALTSEPRGKPLESPNCCDNPKYIATIHTQACARMHTHTHTHTHTHPLTFPPTPVLFFSFYFFLAPSFSASPIALEAF